MYTAKPGLLIGFHGCDKNTDAGPSSPASLTGKITGGEDYQNSQQ